MAGNPHPGFQAVQNKIAAKEGVSKVAAGAILASKSRNASPSAKKANPKLNKVNGNPVKSAAISRRLAKFSSGKGKGNSPKGMKEGTKAEESKESPAFEKREDKFGS